MWVMQSLVHHYQKLGYVWLTSNGTLSECVCIWQRFNHEMFDSVGLRMIIKILLEVKGGAKGIIQGEWDLMIQHVSSTISSPFMPCICKIVSVCRVLSDPVGTPVSNCRYFRRNVLPERGKEQKAILLLRIGYPSKKTPSLSNIQRLRSHSSASFDLKTAVSCSRLRTGVDGMARICSKGSSVYPGYYS